MRALWQPQVCLLGDSSVTAPFGSLPLQTGGFQRREGGFQRRDRQ